MFTQLNITGRKVAPPILEAEGKFISFENPMAVNKSSGLYEATVSLDTNTDGGYDENALNTLGGVKPKAKRASKFEATVMTSADTEYALASDRGDNYGLVGETSPTPAPETIISPTSDSEYALATDTSGSAAPSATKAKAANAVIAKPVPEPASDSEYALATDTSGLASTAAPAGFFMPTNDDEYALASNPTGEAYGFELNLADEAEAEATKLHSGTKHIIS